MDIRLVAYRRNLSTDSTYNIKEFELDLQKNPNIVVNYNWIDLKSPEKRKSSFSQTIKLPFTNRNNKFFENWFDVNLDTLVYNTKKKFEAILYIDSVQQLKGFIELKSIYLNAKLYEVALFGDTANFFTDIKDNRLKDAFRTQDTTNPSLFIEDKQLDHKLTLANIYNSWGTGLTTVESTTTNDIMYPIIDWGHTQVPFSDSMFWNPADLWTVTDEEGGDLNTALSNYGMVVGSNLKPAIRLQRLFHIIAQKAGYQIKSAFMGIDDTAETPITDTQFFSRLFMTLSTQHDKVQSIFNTSGGSEAPFVGFEANMSAATNADVQIAGWAGFETSGTYTQLVVNNEVYDPNGLYNDSIADWGVTGLYANTPSIQMPLNTDGNQSLLPQGNFEVKVTISITLAATTTTGGDYGDGLNARLSWKSQSTGYFVTEDAGYTSSWAFVGMGQNITAGETATMEFTQLLPNNPGEIFFLRLAFWWDSYNPSGTYVNVTVNSCTIETMQTGVTTIMGGGINGEVQMYHNMPDMTQSDFVKDLINRFNLIVSTDPDNERLLLIEPYQDYITGGSTLYYTDKLDTSKEMVVKSTNQFQYRHLKYKDLEDEDILNQRYTEQRNLVYGEYNEYRNNEFAGKEFTNFSKMSPFIAQGIGHYGYNQATGLPGISGASPVTNVAVAYCFGAKLGEESNPLSSIKPKLFYYSGTPVQVTGTNTLTNNAYDFHLLSPQYMQTYDAYNVPNNEFPLCLQYDLNTLGDITADTKILNWTYYSPNFNSGFTFNVFGNTYSTHGYFEDYWSQYINELYSDEARIMECYLNLNEQDIRLFTEKGFQNKYYIKNTLWRIINIQGHLVGGNKSTKVTLLKVIDKLTNECGAIPTFTASGLMTWTDSATGASTTITNSCCEEINDNWSFVQTNETTGEGDCYSSDSITGGVTDIATEDAGGVSLPMPSMLNLESNYIVNNSLGGANATCFYIQSQTLDNINEYNFSFMGNQTTLMLFPISTMTYIKMTIMGSIMSGTNTGKVGYFEADTMIVNRNEANLYVGAAGGTLLKSNKDSAFTNPTLNISSTTNKMWTPKITGGADEIVNWTAKVEVIRQPISEGEEPVQIKALFQNSAGILFENLNNLEWN